jgi:predicted lipoprotein with Yx(FWY)xxD motif
MKMQRTNRSNMLVKAGPVPRMAVALTLSALLFVLGLAVAGSMAGAAGSSSATVSLHATPLGKVLANSHGRTLYLFAKDKGGKSSCSGTCAQYWPPLLVHGKPSAGSGVKASLLGTVKRSDGKLQVTYHKHPLYTYAGDKSAGQANGQGVNASGAKWYVLSAAGSAIHSAPVAAATTAPATTAPATTTTDPTATTAPATTAPPTTTTTPTYDPGY